MTAMLYSLETSATWSGNIEERSCLCDLLTEIVHSSELRICCQRRTKSVWIPATEWAETRSPCQNM
jgi:hypothetical protein